MKKKILSIENLDFLYSHYTDFVLEKINLTIFENDFLFIIGPNGGGKTTLVKIILGLLAPISGNIFYGNYLKKNFNKIGYVPQIKNYDFKFPIKVIDLVLMGSLKPKSFFFKYPQNIKMKALETLSFLGIDKYKEDYIANLSGGQAQKVFLARSLMVSPILLILDEPTAFLDPKGIINLTEILKDLSKNMTIIIVSHDISVTLNFARQVACLNKKLYYHNDVKKLSINDIQHVYNCSIEIIKSWKNVI